jgi:hypothetical protein
MCKAAARCLFYARLRGLPYAAVHSACQKPARRGEWRANAPRSRKLSEFAARARDNDDLFFDSLHNVLLSTFHFPISHFFSARLFLKIIEPGV